LDQGRESGNHNCESNDGDAFSHHSKYRRRRTAVAYAMLTAA
jgi:hypothetical protein